MNRITLRQPIAEALALLPPRIADRVDCDYLTGCDPVFVGLHKYADAGNGRSYKDVAHATWLCHQEHLPRSRRAPTIVLPYESKWWTVGTIVHELGHILDESIAYERHTPEPVSDYAEKNTYEAFAEAFVLWAAPTLATERDGYRLDVLAGDAQTLRMFEELAA